MRVLIAEDDPNLQSLLGTYLHEWGYEVETTNNGDDAWKILNSAPRPEIALLDWVMPGQTGVELCKRLSAQKRENPTYTILLTALNSKENIVEGLEAGASDFISKPFDSNELEARINVGRKVVELQDALSARVAELQNALDHVKTLQGILPICSHCHHIRNDQESWQRLESYFSEHSDIQFSHGICPACMKKHHPEFCDEK